jgi:hypothetical protein
MRKQIKGLSELLLRYTTESLLFSGAYYVFCGKRKNIIKILYWDFDGFCLVQKTLDNGNVFPWPVKFKVPLIAEDIKMLRRLFHGKNIWVQKAYNPKSGSRKAV